MRSIFLSALIFMVPALTLAVQAGQKAPEFKLQTHEGKTFSLSERKNKGWTVLFFYPKAGTPGCTKQVCAFRDSIEQIKALGAEVYGISSDTVEAQAKFHKEHKLLFTLLADPKLEAINKYGAKMTGMDMAKRYTYIIDPDLVVRSEDLKVDPVLDAAKVAKDLKALQSKG